MASSLDRIEVEIPADVNRDAWPLPFKMQSAQTVIRGFPYYLPGSHAPVLISVTDIPVATDESDNHSAETAKALVIPCEVSGRLAAGNEQDWFSIDARRGEVLYLEGFAERLGTSHVRNPIGDCWPSAAPDQCRWAPDTRPLFVW